MPRVLSFPAGVPSRRAAAAKSSPRIVDPQYGGYYPTLAEAQSALKLIEDRPVALGTIARLVRALASPATPLKGGA